MSLSEDENESSYQEPSGEGKEPVGQEFSGESIESVDEGLSEESASGESGGDVDSQDSLLLVEIRDLKLEFENFKTTFSQDLKGALQLITTRATNAVTDISTSATQATESMAGEAKQAVADMKSEVTNSVSKFTTELEESLNNKLIEFQSSLSLAVNGIVNAAITDLSSKVDGSIAAIDTFLSQQVEEMKGSLRQAFSEFKGQCEVTLEETTLLMSGLSNQVEDQQAQLFAMLSTMVDSVSLSYLNWVADAQKAAKTRLDASLYAHELNNAVEDLREVIVEVANAQSLIRQLEKLVNVHALIVPHLEQFSNIARKAVDTSYTQAAADIVASLNGVKDLLTPKKGTL